MVVESIQHLCKAGRQVIFDAEHFFDGWKGDAGYARAVILAAAQAGAQLVVFCDTNGGSMPEEIAAVTEAALRDLPVPCGIHCHNDCGLAVANSLAAVDAGTRRSRGRSTVSANDAATPT